MINRRSFLRLVRNRVAAGVLCSGMLTDALERSSQIFDVTHYGAGQGVDDTEAIQAAIDAQFWHSQYMNDPTKLYGVGIAQQTEEFAREVAKIARQKMEEHDGL